MKRTRCGICGKTRACVRSFMWHAQRTIYVCSNCYVGECE